MVHAGDHPSGFLGFAARSVGGQRVAVPAVEIPVETVADSLDGYKILVTDDEPDFVTFVSTVLEDNGATVYEAFTGDEAIDIARKEKPDLITLDISMPGKSGKEVFEEMRLDKDLKTIAIIANAQSYF